MDLPIQTILILMLIAFIAGMVTAMAFLAPRSYHD